MRFSAAQLGAVLLFPSLAGAQEVKLTQPTARLRHQFSSIMGLRELPDGRVMVADGIDNVVVRVDLASQKMDTVGRAGQGPGEYKSPDALFQLPDGATLLMDLGNARLSVFDATGKYRESMPMALGQPGGPGGFSLVVPRATDAKGRIYFQPMNGGARADSAPVVRWDRAAGKFDSIARVKLPVMITKTSGGANERRVSQRQPPYPVQESWAVAPDGRLALIRAPVYRVDWVPASGARVVGSPIPGAPVPVRDAEKREYLAESAANGLSVSVNNDNGNVSMQFSRGRSGGGATDEPDLKADEWPPTKPAVTGTILTDPSGQLWVERSVPAGAARVYEVVGPDAKVIRRVSLPVGRRLLAVGARGLYVRQVDADGINYLEKYPLQ